MSAERRLQRLAQQLRPAAAGEATYTSRGISSGIISCSTSSSSSSRCPVTSGEVPRILLEFFFDTTSPWSYLAFSRVREIRARTGATLQLRPVLVGGVFNAANPELYAARDAALARASKALGGDAAAPTAKDRWAANDMQAWAAYLGIDIKPMLQRFMAKTRSGGPGHPISAVKVMRGAIVAQQDGDEALMRYAFAAFDAYWGRLLDVSDDKVMKQLHDEASLSVSLETFMQRINSEEVKAKLRQNTEELVGRGGFGTPTLFISRQDDSLGKAEMHFGNDRMELVEAAILRGQGRQWHFHDTCGVPPAQPMPAASRRSPSS